MTNGLGLVLSEESLESGPRRCVVVLQIVNPTDHDMVVEPVRPRLPPDVHLIRHVSSSETLVQLRIGQMQSDLDHLARTLFTTASDETRAIEAAVRKQQRKDDLLDVARSLLSFSVLAAGLALATTSDQSDRSRSEHLPPQIETSRDAGDVHQLLLDLGVSADDPKMRVFDAKCLRLRDLEREQMRSRQLLAPGDTITSRFPLRLPRGGVNPHHVTFGVEVESWSTAADAEPGSTVCTQDIAVRVAPSSAKVTGIAMLGALLGVIVRVIGEGRDLPGTTHDKWWPPLDIDQSELADLVFSADVGGALVVALVLALMTVANLDRLPWTRDLALGAGWRSAILVGIVTGLYGDRVLAALGAFVGTTGL